MDAHYSSKLNILRHKEKLSVSYMIALYCKKMHKDCDRDCMGYCRELICIDCADLDSYACLRTDKCAHMLTKSSCSNCKTPCYKPQMRQKIKQVMRFSGPRMFFVHPIIAILYLIRKVKS